MSLIPRSPAPLAYLLSLNVHPIRLFRSLFSDSISHPSLSPQNFHLPSGSRASANLLLLFFFFTSLHGSFIFVLNDTSPFSFLKPWMWRWRKCPPHSSLVFPDHAPMPLLRASQSWSLLHSRWPLCAAATYSLSLFCITPSFQEYPVTVAIIILGDFYIHLANLPSPWLLTSFSPSTLVFQPYFLQCGHGQTLRPHHYP